MLIVACSLVLSPILDRAFPKSSTRRIFRRSHMKGDIISTNKHSFPLRKATHGRTDATTFPATIAGFGSDIKVECGLTESRNWTSSRIGNCNRINNRWACKSVILGQMGNKHYDLKWPLINKNRFMQQLRRLPRFKSHRQPHVPIALTTILSAPLSQAPAPSTIYSICVPYQDQASQPLSPLLPPHKS